MNTLNALLLNPLRSFAKKSSFSAIILFLSAFVAVIIANSPWHGASQKFLNHVIGFTIGEFQIYKPLLLWINDGLMSVFFFVVGLELKRELLSGELSSPKKVIMPIVGAIGGLVVPALIYVWFNGAQGDEALRGWGIPMATDIAFALGVLYLLGDKVPIQLKVFLTALAIIDDIGAVLVVAIFYTSELSVYSLVIGSVIFGMMMFLNLMGVRKVLVYAVLGIGGLWMAVLLSGVHATIAAVIAAFAIPANRVIDKEKYGENLGKLRDRFISEKSDPKKPNLLTANEQNILGEISRITNDSISPLQRLETSIHGLVLYVVMPIFALANAGVNLSAYWFEDLTSPVSLGIVFGLVLGKVVGIYGACMLGLKLKLYKMPEGVNHLMVLGVSLLAGIGFTMSLFITSLAFTDYTYIAQAKIGILMASVIAGTLGYWVLWRSLK